MKSFAALTLVLLSFPLLGQTPIAGGTIDILGLDLPSAWKMKTIGNPAAAFNERVWAIKFSQDGEHVFTATDCVEQLDWRTKRRHRIWAPGKDESFNRALFSHDGRLFARTIQGDKVHVHETATGEKLLTLEGSTPGHDALAWSPDDRQLAVGIKADVVIHELATGKPIRVVKPGDTDVSAIDWSPDGQWLAVATEDPKLRSGKILLLSLEGNKAPVIIPGTENAKFSFSPDSSTLAVACENGNRDILYLWDIKKGKEIKRIGGGFNRVTHSPDGQFLVAGGRSKLLVLNARTGDEICSRPGDSVNTHFYGLAFSPDGKVLAAGVEDRIRFRDTSTWELIDADENQRAPVSALTFTADGRHLITGGWNGDLILWDWEKKIPVWKRFAAPEQWDIRSLSVDTKSRWIGVSQPARHPIESWLRLVDFNSGKTLRYIDLSTAGGAPLFRPDRDTAYVTTREFSIREVDCKTGASLAIHPVPFLSKIKCDEPISEMSFDLLDNNVIHWAADTQAMGRINLRSGEEIFPIDAGRNQPDADPIPSRDHEYAAIGDRILNLPSLYEPTRGQNGTSCPHARHPSGLLHFTASASKVRVFDIMSQQFIKEFEMGPGHIDAITLSPDGRTLVAGTTGGLKHISLEGPPVEVGKSNELWNLMGGEDPWMAWQAAWALAQQADYIPFISAHLKPAAKPSEAEVARVKSMLSDSDHEVRQTAARQWLDLGFELDKKTYGSLKEDSLTFKWPEVENAHLDLITQSYLGYSLADRKIIPPLIPLSDHRRAMRALSLLQSDPSDSAHQLLKQLAQGHPETPLTQAALKSLRSSK